MTQTSAEAHSDHSAEHGHHNPYLAHHFDTEEQQFDSGKLGMWLFLATEILLFSGLFCAYAVYRANHPEIFMYAHQYLDKFWGGVNTVILIFSSFTMAWAVRAAQLNQRKLLIANLIITLLCACGFLGVKYVEYKHKWEDGLLWGTNYDPKGHYAHGAHGEDGHGDGDGEHADEEHAADGEHEAEAGAEADQSDAGEQIASAEAPAAESGGVEEGLKIEHSNIPDAPTGPSGLSPESTGHDYGPSPKNVHIFFGIYFSMTGLHGLHVLAGMAAIGWILIRALRGEFGSNYYLPVDLVGLYWHVVDLVWIYLFPLLYLIH